MRWVFLHVRGANQYPLRCMNHNDIPNSQSSHINSLRPRRSRRYLADDIFKHIFLKENVRISIKISLKFDPKSPIDNIPPLFQIMAWRRSDENPLSEAMMVSLLTHICVTRLQWVKHTSNHTSWPQVCLITEEFHFHEVQHNFGYMSMAEC